MWAVPATQAVARGRGVGAWGRPGRVCRRGRASERSVKPRSADPAAPRPGVRAPLPSVTVSIAESRADFLAVIVKYLMRTSHRNTSYANEPHLKCDQGGVSDVADLS